VPILVDVLRGAPFASRKFPWYRDKAWVTKQLELEEKVWASAQRVAEAKRVDVEHLRALKAALRD